MNASTPLSGDFEVRVNGTQMFAGQESDILSFTVIGSDDNDTFTITETAGGLPLFSADGATDVARAATLAAPAIDNTGGVGSIGSITVGGESNGAHFGGLDATGANFGGAATNIAQSFETYLDRQLANADDANLRTLDHNQVTIHFEGHDGNDAIAFDLTTPGNDHDAMYFSDYVDIANGGNSGNIAITDGEANEDPQVLMSFANLEPITFTGTSGSLRLDASDTAATYQLTLEDADAGMANGVNVLTGDNGFETTTFSGFEDVEIYGGTGSEIIDLVTLDGNASTGGNAIVTLRLDGDNAGAMGDTDTMIGTDTASDVIHVRSLPGTVTLSLFGGQGDDHFLIFDQDAMGDEANTVDMIEGVLLIAPTGGVGQDAEDENGTTDRLMIVDRGDATGDNVMTTGPIFVNSTTINGLFDSGTGTDITYSSTIIDELILVTSGGDDHIDVDFGGVGNELDVIEIYSSGGADRFDVDSDTPAGAVARLDGDENVTVNAVSSPNTGANDDILDFETLPDGRIVDLFGVGFTATTVTSDTAFTVGGAAMAGTLLNNLDQNTANYPVLGTDVLVITGTDTDNSTVNTDFQVNAATTLGDLRDAINMAFSGATATIDGSGNIVLTATATGPLSLSLAIVDRIGNQGATMFPTFSTTDDGRGGSFEAIQMATAMQVTGPANASLTTTLNSLLTNTTDYDGAAGTGADSILITGVDTDGSMVNATLANVGAGTTVNALLNEINGAYSGATATFANGLITLTADAEGTFPLELIITDAATSDGQTRWDTHVFLQSSLGTAEVIDGFTGTETSINGSFTNIDEIRGPGGNDTINLADLANHIDVGDPDGTGSATDDGVIVASRGASDPYFGQYTIAGRPTGSAFTGATVPIQAFGALEQDLRFFDFEIFNGGEQADHFDLRNGSALTGPINGNGGSDSLDYRDFTSAVTVDLFTGTATNIASGAAGGIVLTGLPDTDGASIEHVFGGAGDDNIEGDNDNNILGDGPGSDYLNGGGFNGTGFRSTNDQADMDAVGGDDIFRLEPDTGDADVIQDINGNDTVDFRFASGGIGDGGTGGTAFDMDITNAAQNANGGTVEFQRFTSPAVGGNEPQPVSANSFMENFIGSTFNDYVFIDPLSLSGNFPVGSPPVPRSADGNNPPNGTEPVTAGPGSGAITSGPADPIPPGDTIDFDSKGQAVIDTGLSFTADGVGTVAYRNFETIIPFENPVGRILDNQDRGFRLTDDALFPTFGLHSHWQEDPVGFGGDQHTIRGADDTDRAIWTFDGVTPGLYRVSATWSVENDADLHVGRSTLDTNAPFTIYDGATAVAGAVVNFQEAPGDFVDAGVTWDDLASAVAIFGNELVVELDPISNANADAIRIERLSIETAALAAPAAAGATMLTVNDATVFPDVPFSLYLGSNTTPVTVSAIDVAMNQLTTTATPAAFEQGTVVQRARPEIDLLEGDTVVADNSGALDFGITRTDVPVTRSLTIVNRGNSDLDVTFGAPPTGFQTSLAAMTTVPAGETLAFSVTLEATAVGDYSGTFEFTTNDVDEETFTFRVSGSVADSVIIDDGDSGFSVNGGAWSRSVALNNGFQFDRTVSDGQLDPTTDTVSWQFDGLAPGNYRVSVTYPSVDTREFGRSDATYQVVNGALGGAVLSTTTIDQNVAPDDLAADGTVFEDLPTVAAFAGGTLTVVLAPGANHVSHNAALLADAVRVERLPDPALTVTVVAPNQDVADDSGVVDFGTTLAANPVQRTIQISNPATSAGPVTITGPISPPDGFSLVTSSAFGTNATPVVLNPGASTSFILQFDAGVAGTASGRIEFATDATGQTPFDFAVTGQAQARIIDNLESDFSIAAGFEDDWVFHTSYAYDRTFRELNGNTFTGPDVTNVARWTFSDLDPGVYRVAATWPVDSDSDSVTFNVYDGGISGVGTLRESVTLSQALTPDDFYDRNGYWEDFGALVTVTSDTVVVEMPNTATGPGRVPRADAVRLERTTDPELIVTLAGAELIDNVSSVSFGTTPVGTSVTQTFIVQNQGVRTMFIDGSSLASDNPAFDVTGFGSTTLEPGTSTTFQVTMLASAGFGGQQAGTVSFAADDRDESLFSFDVTGVVTGTTSPNISAAHGATPLTSSQSVVSFGNVAPGTPVTQTINITNTGNATLTLSSVTLPVGFTSNFVPGTAIGMLGMSSFDITMTAESASTFTGLVTISSDDPDNPTLEFGLLGTVTHASIIDDASGAGFSVSGTLSSEQQGYFKRQLVSNSSADGVTDTATWSFTGLTAGSYRVSATWEPIGGNIATDAQFSVTELPGLMIDPVDQTRAPDDFSEGGATWEDLTAAPIVITGTTLTVQLSNAGLSGRILADAVRIERIDGPEIYVRNTTAGADIKHGAVIDLGDINLRAPESVSFEITNSGTSDLELDTIPALADGFSLATPLAAGALAPGGTATFTVQFDATSTGAFATTVAIPSNDPDERSFEFTLIGNVSIDMVVDNDDAGFSVPNAEWQIINHGVGRDHAVHRGFVAPDVTSSATWVFNDLEPNGTYFITTTWPLELGLFADSYGLVPEGDTGGHPETLWNNETEAVFTVTSGGNSQSDTFNQQLSPGDAFNADDGVFSALGTTWAQIGGMFTVDGTSLAVELASTAKELDASLLSADEVLADAVRIINVMALQAAPGMAPAGISAANVTEADVDSVASQAVDRWQAAGLTSAVVDELSAVTYRVAPLDDALLGFYDESSNQIVIDEDAAGWGWFVDATADDSSEFEQTVSSTELQSRDGDDLDGRIDLLTVVMHELGHVAGFDDLLPHQFEHSLMSLELDLGTRRLPPVQNVQVDVPGDTADAAITFDAGDIVVSESGVEVARYSVSGFEDVTIAGTDGSENFSVDLSGATVASMSSLTIQGLGGDDSVSVTGLSTAVSGNVLIDAGDGNDAVDAGAADVSLTIIAGAGHDMVTGGPGNDRIEGGSGNDVLVGAAGADVVFGNSGADVIHGGDGDDTLRGGAAADEVFGDAGNDVVDGGGSSGDSVSGGTGDDLIDGGSGTDRLVESGDVDFVLTNSTLSGLGNDQLVSVHVAFLTGGDSDNTFDAQFFAGMGITVFGLDGDDVVLGTPAADRVFAGGGDDYVAGGGSADRLFGGAGADTLAGEDGDDIVKGGGGSGDWISGGLGDDLLDGGIGNDRLVEAADVDFTLTDSQLLGLGNDRLIDLETAQLSGGASDNVIDATAWTGGPVIAYAGDGDDQVFGSAQNDRLFGQAGDDILVGGSGDDLLSGGEDSDVLTGNFGNDVIIAGSGDDTAFGNEGNDSLLGEDGIDALVGGVGADTLDGGSGLDSLASEDGSGVADPLDVVFAEDASEVLDIVFADGATADELDTI
ncbi:MAG: choice-of-anchor D domain-containing protein [Planctomycetota bacterium]|jgi:Ca2+-binding RTX toxin-like protein